MVVSSLTVSERQGSKNLSLTHPAPGWSEIKRAIYGLDGKDHTMVTLTTMDDSQMSIVGGDGGRYTVHATFDWNHFLALAQPSRQGDEQFSVNGVPRKAPARNVVGRNLVLKAAKVFALLGALESGFTWDNI